MLIQQVLNNHVLQTAFYHQSDLATGHFWGSIAQLEAEIAKANPDPSYLSGWEYLITCKDGSVKLEFNGTAFTLKPSITPSSQDSRLGHILH